ncbi:uncharacterized protein LOC143292873 [Babylonia areolata]|uniref:uncharacterized protein LOC143292873 n=1 Tax=Babylonia areolata TaxID=304850 RepID=UPI003FD0C067
MRMSRCSFHKPSMQRGFFPRLICRAVKGAVIPADRRVSVVFSHLRHCSATAHKMSYSLLQRGQLNTLDYRIFFKGPTGNIISPFHDIPLFDNKEAGTLNMVVEIPRWSNAKMEINKEDKLNPIKQDVKKGKLRYVKNIFPHHGYIWNYGALPQTWEDPKHKFSETSTAGDNDPLDVCEIGQKVHERGAVIQVKVLGTMLLIDEGETDWKIIAIDVTDPLAEKLNDIGDVQKEMPGFLRATYEWFRFYKKPDGKPENQVHWNGECKNKEFAMQIVNEAHNHWKALIINPDSGSDIACDNTTVQNSPKVIPQDEAMAVVQKTAEPGAPVAMDQEVNKWYYVIS